MNHQHERAILINDSTETIRRQRLLEINAESGSRKALEARHGKVWDTKTLSEEFLVLGFMAPFISVERKCDGQKGSMEFQHSPRLYFKFILHDDKGANHNMMTITRKFPLGSVVATPGALTELEKSGQTPLEFIERHSLGDWGDELCAEDRRLNDEALVDGSRLLSAYKLKTDVKIWVITEAAADDGNRAATTVLLPDEY